MSSGDRLTLEWLAGRYAVCRADAREPLPRWAIDALQPEGGGSGGAGNSGGAGGAARIVCVARSEREVSIVIDESLLPVDASRAAWLAIERGFIALRIAGTLEFNLVGILAQLTAALANANVPVFAISTYDTDVLLVRESDRQRVAAALRDVARFA